MTVRCWVFDWHSVEWISKDKALVPVRGSHSGSCLHSHFPDGPSCISQECSGPSRRPVWPPPLFGCSLRLTAVSAFFNISFYHSSLIVVLVIAFWIFILAVFFILPKYVGFHDSKQFDLVKPSLFDQETVFTPYKLNKGETFIIKLMDSCIFLVTVNIFLEKGKFLQIKIKSRFNSKYLKFILVLYLFLQKVKDWHVFDTSSHS